MRLSLGTWHVPITWYLDPRIGSLPALRPGCADRLWQCGLLGSLAAMVFATIRRSWHDHSRLHQLHLAVRHAWVHQ